MLPDILKPGLAVVFCGTAIGTTSANRGAYYAHPSNRFWQILRDTRLTDRLFNPEEFRLLPLYGLGLTDIVKTLAGSDNSLPMCAFDRDGLRAKMMRYSPRVLAFNGKRAARAFVGSKVTYGPLPTKVGTTAMFVLPSTSGAARRFWDVNPWNELAALAR